MPGAQPDVRIALLLRIVDQAYSQQAWHGATLKGALRGLSVETALFKPNARRNCIWELLLHAAYWKYIVIRRLKADKTMSFPRKPSNFPAVPADPTPRALRQDLALLQEQHELLRSTLLGFPPDRLDRRSRESKWTHAEHVHGVAAHDLYHAGQVQLLKRLHKDR